MPSLAMRSMLGVLYPTTPCPYALMLVWPTSSPKMTRMLGFFFASCLGDRHGRSRPARRRAAASLLGYRFIVLCFLLLRGNRQCFSGAVAMRRHACGAEGPGR